MTKPDKTMGTKLTRIKERSKEDINAEFEWLMPHFNKENLIKCFKEIDGRKAKGADGVSKEEYGGNLESNIEDLITRMKAMSYTPGPVKEVLIPKDKAGEFRPLGISNFEDKIVQLMMSKVLNAVYEPTFRDCSYGFRPNLNCHSAIKDVVKYLSENQCEAVLDIDLGNFFGTIDHKTMSRLIETKIKDEVFLRYITRMLKSGILSNDELRISDEGTPQGNVASPILANVYAHYSIDTWFEDVVTKYTSGPVKLFRYADDIVICCRFRRDAERIRQVIEKRLRKFALSINKDKTKIVSFSRNGFSKGTKQETFDFLGFTFYIGKSKKGRARVKVKTSRKRIRSKLAKVKKWCKNRRNTAKMIILWRVFIKKLEGHIRYYGVTDNTDCVHSFIWESVGIFYKWMNRRSQRKSFTWEKFCKFIRRHKPPRARVVISLF